MSLAGQVAIVTGGGRGIGRAIAARLAAEGADVGIIDVDAASAERARKEVESLNRRAIAVIADIVDYDSVESAVHRIAQELGRLDVLINNAGVEKRAPFLEITPADWRRQIDVNLTGT